MVSALPHGGKRRAAITLGISPSGLSKILGNPQRCFDDKTIRVISWVQSSKSEHYPTDKFPISRVVQTEGIVLETRKMPDSSEFITWRLAGSEDRATSGAVKPAMQPPADISDLQKDDLEGVEPSEEEKELAALAALALA